MSRYHPGITEKRLHNKRFRKTEEAILKAFFDNDNYISIEIMAKRAGVARSTFYHHHRTVGGMIRDYRDYIVSKYAGAVKKLFLIKNVSTRMLYEGMLLFIIHNKKAFRILILGKEYCVFKIMLEKIKPKLINKMRLPKNYERIFLVYSSEVTSLIIDWCRNGFKENEMNKLLDEIMDLTETARLRLKMLLN